MPHPSMIEPEERCTRCKGWGFLMKRLADGEKVDEDCLQCGGTGDRNSTPAG